MIHIVVFLSLLLCTTSKDVVTNNLKAENVVPPTGTDIKAMKIQSGPHNPLISPDLGVSTRTSSISSSQGTYTATITFSADDVSWLLVNGRVLMNNTSPSQYKTVTTTVKNGDVVGLLAHNKGGSFGAIIDVFYNKRHFSTGSSHWKAHKFVGSMRRRWMRQRFSSCSWRRPVRIRPRPQIIRARGFPYRTTGAAYVWAKRRGNGNRNTIFLRHVVGGEKCGISSKKKRRTGQNMATIRFSADDKAWLFINGWYVAQSTHPKKYVTITKRIKRGDVIAVAASNSAGAHGVIIDVFFKNRHYSTSQGHWKAHNYLSSIRKLWKLRRFSSCKWLRAVPVQGTKIRMAEGFPYKTGAKYVWADPKGLGRPHTIFLRHVVGGEQCNGQNTNLVHRRKMAVIRFAADDKAWLFINGQRIARTLTPHRYRTIRRRVKGGDVIGIQARSKRPGFGVIVDVLYKGKHYATSQGSWKAHKRAPWVRRKWKSKRFSSCSWKNTIRIKERSIFFRARGFPYKATGARYVWASNEGRGDIRTIFLRHTIGGEKCPETSVPSHQNTKAVMRFSASGKAWLFINQNVVAQSFDPKRYTTVQREVKKGDILSVAVHNSGGSVGVILDAFYENKHFVSASGNWKAHNYHSSFGNRWIFQNFSTCSWDSPVPVASSKGLIMARGFPYNTGARYVWARPEDPGKKNAIILRHTVGGENCARNTSKTGHNSVSGQSSDGTAFCHCSLAPGKKGTCWQMVESGKKTGRCKARDCDVKYECGATSTTRVCIKRIALERVVPNRTPGHCTTIEEKTEFFVPYQ